MHVRAPRSEAAALPAPGHGEGLYLPVRVTPFYRRRMARSGCAEQLRRMVEAAPAERAASGQWDTSGE